MVLNDFFMWLTAQTWAQTISGTWMFPVLESLHVVGLAVLIGSIAFLDLRLIGVTLRHWTVTRLTREVLPWTWGGFALVMATGVLMFCGGADLYAANPAFRVKLVLLVLAGANMLAFHLFAYRSVARWDTGPATILGAKIAGGLSLLFWAGVVVAGRAIAFT